MPLSYICLWLKTSIQGVIMHLKHTYQIYFVLFYTGFSLNDPILFGEEYKGKLKLNNLTELLDTTWRNLCGYFETLVTRHRS